MGSVTSVSPTHFKLLVNYKTLFRGHCGDINMLSGHWCGSDISMRINPANGFSVYVFACTHNYRLIGIKTKFIYIRQSVLILKSFYFPNYNFNIWISIDPQNF